MLAAPAAAQPGSKSLDGAVWQEAQELSARLGAEDSGKSVAFRAAQLEVTMGRHAGALGILTKHGGADSLWDATGFRVRGEAEYGLGQFQAAARSFVIAAELEEGTARGILTTRAGVAYERAGMLTAAAAQYGLASDLVPELAGWLALREASVSSDTARAIRLLAEVEPEAEPLAAAARGLLYARAGDTSSAVAVLEQSELPGRAASLALSAGDSATARRLAYAAVVAEDTSVVRTGFTIVEEGFPPVTASEYLALSKAAQRLGSLRDASQYAAETVAAGDSSAGTLVFLGDLWAARRYRSRALAAYRIASTMEGEAAIEAAFKYGRSLLLVGRASEGMSALADFVERYPDHPSVPRAFYGMADRRRRERRLDLSDSLNQIVAERWPRNSYASLARMDLAADALSRGDTTAAIEWYREEIEVLGMRRNVAQYRLGALRAATDDTIGARAVWAALARRDSLGYYGTIARTAARLPPLDIEPSPGTLLSNTARNILTVIELLRESYLDDELAVLIDSLKARRSRSPPELLDLAEGLIELGFVSEGIHLGWLASRAYTLNHPRVLRAVFPWPYRDLIEHTARELRLDPHLLAGLIRQESAFTPTAISRAGAHGLMQLMPPTAREVARRIGAVWDEVLLTVPDANLRLGATHLEGLLRRYDDRVLPSLAAYNAGGVPVRRWMASWDGEDAVQFIENVTYNETRGYLRTVLRNWALYRSLYPMELEESDSGQ